MLIALPQIGRRRTVAWLGALAFLPGAAPSRLVLAARDRAFEAAILAIWGAPFAGVAHAEVDFDGAGFDPARLPDMVDDGGTAWDVCLADAAICDRLGRAGLLEMLDYQVIDRRADPAGFAIPWWGIPAFLTSGVLACDSTAFPGGWPRRWAEFWDTATWPGRRAMPAAHSPGVCEAALLADGVGRDRLYPLDLDRAFVRLAALKPQLLFYRDEMQARLLLATGAAVMGMVRNTTALRLRRASGGRIDWTWNEALMAPCLWMVPKGNPAGRALAMRFIASTQLPDRQLALLQTAGCGPANPQARAALAPPLAEIDPGAPANLALSIPLDQGWYNDNEAGLAERWQRFVAA